MAMRAEVKTFINPAGIIEQHYIGDHYAPSVEAAVKKLAKLSAAQAKTQKPVLILIDTTKSTTRFDPEVNKVALRGMREINFSRGALCGPVYLQVMLNTVAMVAGKSDKIAGFTERNEAIRWLRTGKK